MDYDEKEIIGEHLEDMEVEEAVDGRKGSVDKLAKVLSSIVPVAMDSLLTRLLEVFLSTRFDIDTLKCCIKQANEYQRMVEKHMTQVSV